MDNIKIINEQYQRPDTLSRVIKNQNMERQKIDSKSDIVLKEGFEKQGLYLGEALKKYLGGKEKHSVAEQVLREKITLGNLEGRASDEGIQRRTQYKTGMYGETLQELDVLNQTEIIEANNFNNKMMSQMAEFAEQPQEVIENQILSFFEGIKEKYKDKPAYANGLITRFSGMAQSLMANYSKQRGAVLQAQADNNNYMIKLQNIDTATSMLNAAGIDEEARSNAMNGLRASFDSNNRAKGESVEAFTKSTVNAIVTNLRNGNSVAFKVFSDTREYELLSPELRKKVDDAADAHDKSIKSEIDRKRAYARIKQMQGDGSAMKSLINEIPTLEAKMTGRVGGQEIVAESLLSATKDIEADIDRQDRRADMAQRRQDSLNAKEDAFNAKMSKVTEDRLANIDKKRQLATTPEERALINDEENETINAMFEHAHSIRDPRKKAIALAEAETMASRHLLDKGITVKSALETNIEKQLKTAKDNVKTKAEIAKNDFTTYNSYTPDQLSKMGEKEAIEVEERKRIAIGSYREQIKEAEALGDTELVNDLVKGLNELNNSYGKSEQEANIYINEKIQVEEEKNTAWTSANKVSFNDGKISRISYPNSFPMNEQDNTKRFNNFALDNQNQMGIEGAGSVEEVLERLEQKAIYQNDEKAMHNMQQLLTFDGSNGLKENYNSKLESKFFWNSNNKDIITEEKKREAQRALRLNEGHNILKPELESKLKEFIKAPLGTSPAMVISSNITAIKTEGLSKEALEFAKSTNYDGLSAIEVAQMYQRNINSGLSEDVVKEQIKKQLNTSVNKNGFAVFDYTGGKIKLNEIWSEGEGANKKTASIYDAIDFMAKQGLFNNQVGVEADNYKQSVQLKQVSSSLKIYVSEINGSYHLSYEDSLGSRHSIRMEQVQEYAKAQYRLTEEVKAKTPKKGNYIAGLGIAGTIK